MIIINEVAIKLQNILNGKDSEVAISSLPSDFSFQIAIDGFHLDHIKGDNHKNFIPCFLSQLGGEFDPVPDIQKQALNYNLTLYYPVRFKNTFYEIANYLATALVGKVMTWGDVSGRCLSTIDPATFGEIAPQDLAQYSSWVNATYGKAQSVSENYMTMSINVYLTTTKGVLWGNDAQIKLYYEYEDINKSFYCKWVSNAFQQENSPVAQQLVNESKHTYNRINNTTNSYSVQFYLNDDNKQLLELWFNDDLDGVNFTLDFKIGDYNFARDVVLLSFAPSFQMGEPVTITLTFGDDE